MDTQKALDELRDMAKSGDLGPETTNDFIIQCVDALEAAIQDLRHELSSNDGEVASMEVQLEGLRSDLKDTENQLYELEAKTEGIDFPENPSLNEQQKYRVCGDLINNLTLEELERLEKFAALMVSGRGAQYTSSDRIVKPFATPSLPLYYACGLNHFKS